MHAEATRPGIFWTWQDVQLDDPSRIERDLADIAAHGFSRALVQPRGCRYPIDDPLFIARVAQASRAAHDLGLELWHHLDPRSFSRSLVRQTGEHAEYLVVAGVGGQAERLPLQERPVDVRTALAEDGRFHVRLDYPKSRPHHVHSDGALTFRPERLVRCLAYQRDAAGLVRAESVHDLAGAARLFTNEIEGHLEVFGRWQPPAAGRWEVLALVAFASNYPDYAGPRTREALCGLLERYARAGAQLDGLWWDEPGYATGFDRRFRADRGRIPFGPSLAGLYAASTGRDAADDLLYLLEETDDGRWGEVRRDYYATLSDAVFGAQEQLRETAERLFGPAVGMGVHHTWHQNADDLPHGAMDWWKGSRVLTGGYSDVGSAEEVVGGPKLAETVALTALAVSLARRARRPEAYINLWGVDYGRPGDPVGPAVMDYWADLMATFGCRWLAHIYGPTGYFERPSVWGPGYPDHPTWERFPAVNERLHRALELSGGALPDADMALVYPLGALERLGSDRANPLAAGVHQLIHALLAAGHDLDIISPAELAGLEPARTRAVLYLHPFGSSPTDLEILAGLRRAGVQLIAAGLPPLAGNGFTGAGDWAEILGVPLAEVTWPELRESPLQGEILCTAEGGCRWPYRGVEGWGRPGWPLAANGPGLVRLDGTTVGQGRDGSAYLQLLLEGLVAQAPALLASLGLAPGWRKPEGTLATRTTLPGGGLVIRACPATYGGSFSGSIATPWGAVQVERCRGFFGLRLGAGGRVEAAHIPDGADWRFEKSGETT